MFSKISATTDRIIGIAELPAPLIGHIRAEQIRAIIRLTPMMMAANIIGALMVVYAAWNSPNRPYVILLTLVLMLIAGIGLQAWKRARREPPRRHASKSAVFRATRHAALLSTIWGAIAFLSYIDGSSTQKLIVATVIVGFATAGAFSLAPMPQAALAFLVPVILSSFMSLLTSGKTSEMLLAGLGLVYAGLIMFTCISHARLFAAHLRSEHDAREQQSVIGMLLKSFEENASDWLWQLDANGRFVHVSDRFQGVFGGRFENLEAVSALALVRFYQNAGAGYREMLAAFRERKAFRDIKIPVRRAETIHWWKLSGEPAFDDIGQFTGFRGVCSDVTDARVAATRVSYLAHHDSLTGALNRSRFGEILTKRIAHKNEKHASFALAYLDLDGFKAVNDSISHQAGDQVLIEVVRRLQSNLPENSTLARLGGDEFAILIDDNLDHARLEALAGELIAAISRPYAFDGHIVSVGASIGLALALPGFINPETMLHNADLALHHAKQSGRGSCRFYSPEMEHELGEIRAIEADLALAISRRQLEVHFQPFVMGKNATIAGFEALLRWRHPERGLVPPLKFIPLAEKSGLITEIGLWVLQEACRVASTWPEHLTLAVNLSSRQFASNSIVEDIRTTLATSGLAADRLELEITESVLIERPEAVIKILKQLKALGVRIAMDDFGTGYSSLSYLWRFPFDKIKIDGSFVAAISHDAGARHILTTISSLAKTMGLSVTAERIETAEEHAFLSSIGCDYLQGFHFFKPLCEADIALCLMQELQAKAIRKLAKSAVTGQTGKHASPQSANWNIA